MRKLLKLTAQSVGGLILGSLLSAIAGAATAPPVAAAESGAWQEHRYSFVFLGFTSTYSCDGLADKLRLLLIASGARADVKARAGACASGFGTPDKFARAELTFFTLAPGGADSADKVAAAWRPVALADRRPYDLGTGDCELVEQFKANLLPMFTTRNVDSHTTCVPHQDSGSVIDLKFDALSAVTPKPANAAPAASK